MTTHARRAFLALDIQVAQVGFVADPEAYLDRCNTALAAARRAGMLVVHGRIAFGPGHREVSRANKMFAHIADQDGFVEGAPMTAIHPSLSREPDDVVVTKVRASAFTGGALEVVLRTHRVDSLVLCGLTTSGGILSTVRQAADMDYELTVLADACDDWDAELHDVLTRKVLPRQAEVVSTQEWISGLAG